MSEIEERIADKIKAKVVLLRDQHAIGMKIAEMRQGISNAESDRGKLFLEISRLDNEMETLYKDLLDKME